MNNSTTDRRAHPRHARSFELEGATDDRAITARMVANNLSLGGVHCTSPADFPEMTRLAVRMMLPRVGTDRRGDRPIELEAVVVRRRALKSSAGSDHRYELALFFTRIADDDRALLKRYLEKTV